MEYKDILLRSKRLLTLDLFGENDTKSVGSGLDYQGSREYTSSDDIRHLNWRQMAKAGGASVKVFAEQKELNIVIAYLASGSLNFGEPTKHDSATTAVTALSFATLKSQNSLTTIYLSKDIKEIKRESKDIDNTYKIFTNFSKTKADGATLNSKEIIEYIDLTISAASIIFFIGDFLEDIDISILNLRHEIYLLIIRDNSEERLELNGRYNILDTNSDKSKIVNIDKNIIKHYNQYMKKFDLNLEKSLQNADIKYTKIYTNDDPIDKIVRMLSSSNE